MDIERAYNDFWWDYGDEIRGNRSSLVIDPPDGKLPAITPEGRERMRSLGASFGPDRSDSWLDRSLWERCILGFNSGPPMIPSAYNNNMQLFQNADHVVILNEMVHSARVIPLDTQPPLSDDIRQWQGSSRGHWEGDTLVVETRNFRNEARTPYFRDSGEGLHLIERFTRADTSGRGNGTDRASCNRWRRLPLIRDREPRGQGGHHHGVRQRPPPLRRPRGSDLLHLDGVWEPYICEFAKWPQDSINKSFAIGVYAQDQWTLDRFTVNAGVRFDYFDTWYPDQEQIATRYAQAAPIEGGYRGDLEGPLTAAGYRV